MDCTITSSHPTQGQQSSTSGITQETQSTILGKRRGSQAVQSVKASGRLSIYLKEAGVPTTRLKECCGLEDTEARTGQGGQSGQITLERSEERCGCTRVLGALAAFLDDFEVIIHRSVRAALEDFDADESPTEALPSKDEKQVKGLDEEGSESDSESDMEVEEHDN